MILHVDSVTVRRLAAAGKIPSYPIRLGRRTLYRFEPSEVLGALHRKAEASPPPSRVRPEPAQPVGRFAGLRVRPIR